MSYQVLARKWRPQTFSELVGQQHVVDAITNALKNDKLHHAYLFTGTRGVGKTTIARIFSKSLNCERGQSAEPCGKCDTCIDISDGRYVDLLEIDAASRTKVEDTRELLDNVQYRPTRGKYKVYLIDEVHMLSKHSFNALLKTLEEPPEHVKFLLATTDPQKLPVTVLSRCLQFSLKALTTEQIQDHLAYILGEEQIQYERSALTQIARAAQGSIRDSLSLTDQAIAQGNNQVSLAIVANMLGLLNKNHIVKLVKHIVERDSASAIAQLDDISAQSPDALQILSQLCGLLHQIALTQVVPEVCKLDSDSAKGIYTLANSVSKEHIQILYQIGVNGKRDLPHAPDARSGLQMTILRMLAFSPAQTINLDINSLVTSNTGLPVFESLPEPKPVPELTKAKAVSASSEPKHASTSSESEPVSISTESKSGSTSTESKPVSTSTESKHVSTSSESEPVLASSKFISTSPEVDNFTNTPVREMPEQDNNETQKQPSSPANANSEGVDDPSVVGTNAPQYTQAKDNNIELAAHPAPVQPDTLIDSHDPHHSSDDSDAENGNDHTAHNVKENLSQSSDAKSAQESSLKSVIINTQSTAKEPTEGAPPFYSDEQPPLPDEEPPFSTNMFDDEMSFDDTGHTFGEPEREESAHGFESYKKETQQHNKDSKEPLDHSSAAAKNKQTSASTYDLLKVSQQLKQYAKDKEGDSGVKKSETDTQTAEVVEQAFAFRKGHKFDSFLGKLPAFLNNGEKLTTAAQVDQWSAFVDATDIQALSRQLLINAKCVSLSNPLVLTLARDNHHINEQALVEKIKATMSELLGEEIEVQIAFDEIQNTPLQIQTSINEMRLNYALELVKNTDSIQELIKAFDARVVDGSVEAR